jgi:hypothetical protein
MNTRSFLVYFIVVMLATSMAMAGSHHGNFAGGFGRNGSGSFHGGNWNRHCHGGSSNFVFVGSFGSPFFGYPYGYGYAPYSYGYSPYGYGYGSGYYGYGSGYYGYGSGYYGNGYYPSSYYRGYGYNGNRSSVVRLQQQLARAGYYRGPIDGIMGTRTRYALRAYRHAHGTANYEAMGDRRSVGSDY